MEQYERRTEPVHDYKSLKQLSLQQQMILNTYLNHYTGAPNFNIQPRLPKIPEI